MLRYTVVGEQPEVALLAHTGRHAADAARLGNGYFLLMVQPRQDDRLSKMPPRELVFLVDVSGSMRGDKTAKVIQAMGEMLKQCRAQDTVQVITFANRSNKLFSSPVPVTEANIRKALDFSAGLQGSGGTEMLKGVQMAIDEPLDAERLRIVVMLTDGFIGNEAEIIEHVGKKCGDRIRFWAIGIGSSPNMFLIDGVARQGGGMGKELGLNDDTVALTHEVMTRIQRAQLSQVQLDWGGVAVSQTYPARIPELWAGRPIILFGRYAGSASRQVIKIRGQVEGEPVAWQVTVDFPAEEPGKRRAGQRLGTPKDRRPAPANLLSGLACRGGRGHAAGARLSTDESLYEFRGGRQFAARDRRTCDTARADAGAGAAAGRGRVGRLLWLW